jgi:hypothetical protein
VRHQVLHQYKPTVKILVTYVLERRFNKKDYGQNGSKHSLNLICI